MWFLYGRCDLLRLGLKLLPCDCVLAFCHRLQPALYHVSATCRKERQKGIRRDPPAMALCIGGVYGSVAQSVCLINASRRCSAALPHWAHPTAGSAAALNNGTFHYRRCADGPLFSAQFLARTCYICSLCLFCPNEDGQHSSKQAPACTCRHLIRAGNVPQPPERPSAAAGTVSDCETEPNPHGRGEEAQAKGNFATTINRSISILCTKRRNPLTSPAYSPAFYIHIDCCGEHDQSALGNATTCHTSRLLTVVGPDAIEGTF